MNDIKRLGVACKLVRDQKGFSKKSFIDRGIYSSQIKKIEDGKSVTTSILFRYLECLDISIFDLKKPNL